MNSKTIAGPRRGLTETQAADYVGFGLTLFREMVADGRMPRARLAVRTTDKNEITRRVWDVTMLDAAFDSLPLEGEVAEVDTWADFSNNGSNQTQKRRAV